MGITRQSVENRWRNGSGYIHNEYFTRAINKNGWDGFEHIILFENKTQEEAENLEILFIKILLSNNQIYGYNISNGGNTIGTHSEATKRKLSKIKTGKMLYGENPKARKVICNGKIFNSAKECAEYYNLTYGTMMGWLYGNDGMPDEYIKLGMKFLKGNYFIKARSDYVVINRNPQCGGKHHKAEKVICDNMVFECIKDCADYYDINYNNMRNWLNGYRNTPKDFLNKGLRKLSANIKDYNFQIDSKKENSYNSINNVKKVICNGKIFDSINKCAKYYNITTSVMGEWLKQKCNMPQKFIDLGLRYLGDKTTIYTPQTITRKKVICDNKIFNSIKECSRYYTENYNTFYYWVTGKTSMPQKYIDLGLHYYNPKVDGDIKQYEQYIETKAI